MCMCLRICGSHGYRSPQRSKVELQMAVSHHVGAENPVWILFRNIKFSVTKSLVTSSKNTFRSLVYTSLERLKKIS